MPLSPKDISALRVLLREEFDAHLLPFRKEVSSRFDKIFGHIDGLYRRDEKREQELVVLQEQLARLEDNA